MTSLKGEGIRVIDKFNGENFNIWKFKLDMNLAFVELWDIVDESKEVPCSNFNSKVKRKQERRVKKTISITMINLVDNQVTHMKSHKGPLEA